MLSSVQSLRDLRVSPGNRLAELAGNRQASTAFESKTSGESVWYGVIATRTKSSASIIIEGGRTMNRPKKLLPIHPGEVLLEEFLEPLGMSMNKLADELHVPANRITQIVEGGVALEAKPRSGWRDTLAPLPNSGWGSRKTTTSRLRATNSRPMSKRQVEPRGKAA
jgi:hypothetical protein